MCSRDLCLEHYFSLDLGPGIEHEVINNPYVVDLLVSFFYTAVFTNKLRDFSKGLRLKVPNLDVQRCIVANVCLTEGMATLDSDCCFENGEPLLLVLVDTKSRADPIKSIWRSGKR